MTVSLLLPFQFVCHVCLLPAVNVLCEIQTNISIVCQPHQHPAPLFDGN